jgi:hypothetical protein
MRKEMKKEMTNIQMLVWGIKHIAKNHGLNAETDYKSEGEVCIWGGCNIPTLSDVRMLCEDLHIERENIVSGDYGIDVYVSKDWWDKYAKKPYEKGMELWKKTA